MLFRSPRSNVLAGIKNGGLTANDIVLTVPQSKILRVLIWLMGPSSGTLKENFTVLTVPRLNFLTGTVNGGLTVNYIEKTDHQSNGLKSF